jgi:hypothetical protein
MFGLIGGFTVAVAIMLLADHAAGGPWAFPLAILICAAAVVLAIVDGQQR